VQLWRFCYATYLHFVFCTVNIVFYFSVNQCCMVRVHLIKLMSNTGGGDVNSTSHGPNIFSAWRKLSLQLKQNGIELSCRTPRACVRIWPWPNGRSVEIYRAIWSRAEFNVSFQVGNNVSFYFHLRPDTLHITVYLDKSCRTLIRVWQFIALHLFSSYFNFKLTSLRRCLHFSVPDIINPVTHIGCFLG